MDKEKTKFYWNLTVFTLGLIVISIRIVEAHNGTFVSDWFSLGTLIVSVLGVISSYSKLRKYFV